MATHVVAEPRSAPSSQQAFSLENVIFRYEPFPVGCAHNVFTAYAYERLVKAWPPTEVFKYKPELGKKYSLSEVNNPEAYHDFVGGCEPWRDLYCWIKSEQFVRMVVQTLSNHRIDLGLKDAQISTTHAFSPEPERRLAEQLRELRSRVGHTGVLKTRFEFSMLPADGGCIKPHTDSPTKLITLVLSMLRPGEWDSAWGGSTAMERPKDTTANFNYMNHQMNFEDMEVLHSYPFQPNQCVLFVKTFNSHHSVHPMTGSGSTAFRRTLTINIEKIVA